MWRRLFKDRYLLIILLFSLPFLFWRLGSNHLIEWDEGIYSLVAKNILKTGDWLTLTWKDGFPWFEKPPLYMWLTAPLIKIFGTTSLVPRFWPAVFGLGTIVSVYYLGRELFGKTAGFISAIILASTIGFLYYSRMAMLDVPVTFFITSSLLFFWLGRDRGQTRYWLAFGLMTALGVLTKGVIGVFPVVIASLYAIFEILQERSFRRYHIKNILIFILCLMTVVLPWHIYMYLKHGNVFWENYLLYHVFLRSSSAIEGKSAPTFWYITVIRTQFRIWFIALIPSLLWLILEIVKRKPRAFLLLFWSAITFSVFTISKSKLIWYIIPIYPALAIIVGGFLCSLFMYGQKRVGNSLGTLFKFEFLAGAVFVVALVYNLHMWNHIYTEDFSAEQVSLIDFKDKIDSQSITLVADLGYSLSSYYSSGPVWGIQSHAATGLFDDKNWKYMIILKETYIEKGMENFPVSVVSDSKNYYLLKRADL